MARAWWSWQLKNLHWLVPRLPPICSTYCSRATGRARLQLVSLDRVFRGLSNGGGFVGFGLVVVVIRRSESPMRGLLQYSR